MASGSTRTAIVRVLTMATIPIPAVLLTAPAAQDVPLEVVEIDVDRVQLESDVPQKMQPFRACEKAVRVAFVLHTHPALLIANQDPEVNQVGRVARVWIRRPLHKTHAATIGVVASVIGVLDERLSHEVWR